MLVGVAGGMPVGVGAEDWRDRLVVVAGLGMVVAGIHMVEEVTDC